MAGPPCTNRGEAATFRQGDSPPDERRGGEDLSTAAAAVMLGVAERTVRRAIARGELLAAKRGASYRIHRDELARYMARNRGPAGLFPLPRVVPFPGPSDHAASLPAPLSTLVGRDDDLAALSQVLTDPAIRLVTLTGPGGIGKTRLAVAAAATVAGRFPEGVVFVPLAAVSDARALVLAIADALGLREILGRERWSQVRDFLRSRRLLLILDNFEHLLAAAPEVAALLAAAPSVTVLVTSRARLRLRGEREVRVPPLAMPRENATREELLDSGAGQLFLARAREHDPAFALDDASARQVADICRRLDGLPLAIELAAARVTVLSPRQLHARLERRLPLLTSSMRDVPDRHGTMRDAIAWSYDLLSVAERRLFRQLAVFVDGCTLEAAEAVGAGAREREEEREGEREGERIRAAGGIEQRAASSSLLSPFPPFSPSPSCLDRIAALVEQSLLGRASGPGGEPRFRMLETIREYGLEQLREEEARAVHAAHAAYFLRFARFWRRFAIAQARREPFDRLAADDANLLAALAWLDDHGPDADFLGLAACCAISWLASSRLREADHWLSRALAKQERGSVADRARLLIAQGELLMLRGVLLMRPGELAQAEDAFAVGLPLMRVTGDPYELGMALISRGAARNYAEAYAAAAAHLEEAHSLAADIADPMLGAVVAAGALSNLAVTARGLGDLTLAARRSEEALHRYQEQQLPLGETRALMDLGDSARDQGNHRLAAARYLECIARSGEWGDIRLSAAALAGIASAATAWGQTRAALLLFGAAAGLRERVGAEMSDPSDGAIAARDLAELRAAAGERDVVTLFNEGRALSLADAAALAASVSDRGRAKSASRRGVAFTRREEQIFALLGQGLTDKEIADRLFLSPRTVSWHVSAILGKLGVESRREAIAAARASASSPS